MELKLLTTETCPSLLKAKICFLLDAAIANPEKIPDIFFLITMAMMIQSYRSSGQDIPEYTLEDLETEPAKRMMDEIDKLRAMFFNELKVTAAEIYAEHLVRRLDTYKLSEAERATQIKKIDEMIQKIRKENPPGAQV